MNEHFQLHVVSDRLLEFNFPRLSDALRFRLFKALERQQADIAPWQVFWVGQKVALISPRSITSDHEFDHLYQHVSGIFAQLNSFPNEKFDSHHFEVQFGSDYSPDLERVAELNRLSVRQWVEQFLQTEFTVGFNGFLPGFSYLSGLSSNLQAPRLQAPRKRVLAGSLAVAGQYCALYPCDSPGGWNIVGWVNRQVFSVSHEPPCLMMPGDTVRFSEVK